MLKDLIDCGDLPVTRLKVTFRQSDDSGIVDWLIHSIWEISPPSILELTSPLPMHQVRHLFVLSHKGLRRTVWSYAKIFYKALGKN